MDDSEGMCLHNHMQPPFFLGIIIVSIYDLPKVVSNQRIRTAIAHTLQKSEPHIYIYIYIPMEVPSTIRVKRRRDDNPVQALGMYILTCTH